MNKPIYKLIIAILGLSLYSCVSDTEIDEVFEGNTQDRVLERLDELNELLLSSEFGWETEYMPGEETGVYRMHMLFNEDGSVEITSDHNSGDNDIDANYRVGISQSPELVFENYSVFANLTDNFDGTVASTNFDRGAEFQFTFTDEADEDLIVLESKSDLEIQDDEGEFISRKTVLTLVKATANTKDEIIALQGLDERINDDFNPNPSVPNEPFRGFRIDDGSSETILSTDLIYNSFDRSARLVYEKDGEDVNEVLGIGLTEEGLYLAEPFEFEGKFYQDFIYDEVTNEFVSEVDGFRAYITRGSIPFYINRDFEEIGTDGFNRLLYRPSLGRNPATSDDFIAITDRLSEGLAPFGFTFFDYILFFNPSNTAQLLIRFESIADPTGGLLSLTYDFEQIIVDRKVKLNFIGPVDGNSDFLLPQCQELIDFFEAPSGLIYSNTGGFIAVLPDGSIQQFSNTTSRLINTDSSNLSVYAVWF